MSTIHGVGYPSAANTPVYAGRAAQPAAEPASNAAASTADVLELSSGSPPPVADWLSAGPFGARGVDQVNFNELQQQAQASVASKLRTLFKQHGIDRSQPIRLRTDALGQVIVTSDTPDKAAIEQFFKDDPELRNDFVRSQSLAELIGAARDAQAFHQAYARNPQAAVNEFAYLFKNTNSNNVTFTIDGDEFQTVYQRLGGSAHVFESLS